MLNGLCEITSFTGARVLRVPLGLCLVGTDSLKFLIFLNEHLAGFLSENLGIRLGNGELVGQALHFLVELSVLVAQSVDLFLLLLHLLTNLGGDLLRYHLLVVFEQVRLLK